VRNKKQLGQKRIQIEKIVKKKNYFNLYIKSQTTEWLMKNPWADMAMVRKGM
jgi:hypothetical protein